MTPNNDPILIYCGVCGARIAVDAARAGKTGRCRACKARIPIPSSRPDRPQIRLFCPKCGDRLRASVEQAGQSMHCAKCTEEIVLPDLSGQAAPGAAASKGDTRDLPCSPFPTEDLSLDADAEEEPKEKPAKEEEAEPGGKEKQAPPDDDDGPTDIAPEEAPAHPIKSRLPSYHKAAQEAAARKARFSCPLCGKTIEHDKDTKETRFRCPHCKKTVAPPAMVVKEVAERPLKTEFAVALATFEVLGAVMLYVGLALLGKGLAMGAWQKLLGLDSQGVGLIGTAMCGVGPVLLLIGGRAQFRGFVAAALTTGALVGFGWAAWLASDGDYPQALKIGAAGILAVAVSGVVTTLGGKKAGLWAKVGGIVLPLYAAAVLYPGISTRDNERRAAEWMQKIGAAEKLFQERQQTDQDEDSVGEYGFLCEAIGEVIPRAPLSNKAVIISGITTDDLQTKAAKGNGIAKTAGYCFRVYLAAPDGAMDDRSCDGTLDVPGTKLDPKKNGKTIDIQEQAYVVYAWPQKAGRTGRKAFAMNQTGALFSTGMEEVRYSGDAAPEARAAYVVDAMPDTFFNNRFAQGGETFDKNVWQMVSAPPKSDAAEPSEKPDAAP